jgi:hypothetical protein
MAEIEIWQPNNEGGRTKVGLIIFDEHPTHLHAGRTALGFNLSLPAAIGLRSAPAGEPQLALEHLRLTFSVNSASGSRLEVGRLYDEERHTAYIDYRGQSPSAEPRQLNLTWSTATAALIAIERSREGGQPTLHVDLRAELGYVIECEHWHKHAVNERRRFPVFTASQTVQEGTDISYPKEVWGVMVQKLVADSQDDVALMLLPLTPFLTGSKT